MSKTKIASPSVCETLDEADVGAERETDSLDCFIAGLRGCQGRALPAVDGQTQIDIGEGI